MGLETGTYPTFVGGTSQQDDTVRSPNQLTEAINTWLHAAMGAGKRPPASFVCVLGSDVDPQAHFHSIVRDAAERYIVVVGNSTLRVFDHETGVEYTVVVTDDALDYLATGSSQPWTMFRTMTIADTTFIVNRSCVVAMDAEMSPGVVFGGAQTLADMPKASTVTQGAIYQISGSPENPFDDYYVEKTALNTYTEIAKPGIPHKYDRKTMPHVLKRIPDAVHADGFFFSFGAPEWEVRLAGDDQSNPEASFTGQTIQEVFMHRDRVGFLSTESVILSETTRYFNFWRTSVTQFLDSDPIDLAVPTKGVATLQHAIPFQSAVFLAGDNCQFLLTAEPYLSAKHIKVDPISDYDTSPYIRPQMLGDSLYFPSDKGSFAAVREYFMDDMSITGDAADVTAHVPRYLPGRVRGIGTSSGADCVVVAMQDAGATQLFTYFVRWSGDEKKQSAWCRWNLSGVGKVSHVQFIGNSCYTVAESPGGGVELLRIDVTLNASDSDATADYSFLLDRMVVLTPLYTALGNFTDIDLPYVLDGMEGVTAVKTDDWADAGAYYDLTGATLLNGGTRIRLPGNVAGGKVAVGLDYECRMSLSKPALRDSSNNTILVGRTQVRDIEVAYNDAAYFEVEVESKGTGHTETYLAAHANAYTARTLNDSVFKLSAPAFHSGHRRFPVLSNADNVRIHLVNRLPFQCWFLSAQWRGLFVSRSKV